MFIDNVNLTVSARFLQRVPHNPPRSHNLSEQHLIILLHTYKREFKQFLFLDTSSPKSLHKPVCSSLIQDYRHNVECTSYCSPWVIGIAKRYICMYACLQTIYRCVLYLYIYYLYIYVYTISLRYCYILLLKSHLTFLSLNIYEMSRRFYFKHLGELCSFARSNSQSNQQSKNVTCYGQISVSKIIPTWRQVSVIITCILIYLF